MIRKRDLINWKSLKMAIASVESAPSPKPDHNDAKQPPGNSLKSAITSNRNHHAKKEIFAPRTSVQRYAELPSLRYGSSPTPTAIQMMGSGPLRVSINAERNVVLGLSKTRLRSPVGSASFDGGIAADGRTGNYRGILVSDNSGEGAPPAAVRRVRFAELPPKFNRGNLRERKAGDEEGKVEKEEGTENRMRNRVGIPSTDVYSVSSNPRFERHCLASSASFPPQTKSDGFTLGNNGAIQGGTIFANKHVSRGHDTARYRHGTLTQAPAATTTSPCLPPLVKAAREGDGDELAEIIRKASHFGISTEDLNATDNSGRTALSYVASNGDIKTLEGILRLPGVDVNKKDNEGNTALHFVAQAGQVEAIGYMISACHELDLDARNTLGFTPLMKAAIQGRTKCAKLLLCAGASPVMRDSGRGLTAEQWARYCGRHLCADVIEKFSRSKIMDRSVDYSRWGSEPELAARLLGGKTPLSNTHQTSSTSSLKSKLRKAFRSTSHPGQEICSKSFSVVSHLTSAALCVSSPLLPSNQSGPSTAKSLVRPLAVPKVQVTLATFGDDICNNVCVAEQGAKERPVTPRPSIKKKQ